MGEAWIGGRSASLDEAAAAAADLLARSRQPVIAGLGVDVAGARAAVALAEHLCGTLDHMHADALLRDLDCAREAGVMLITPSEARMRADVVLLIGPRLDDAWPDLAERLLSPPAQPSAATMARRVFWLCPGSQTGLPGFAGRIQVIGGGDAHLATLLAGLRARVNGRPVGRMSVSTKVIDGLAKDLRSARFGVAVWSATHIEALAVEMLTGIVNDLNATTRFSGLPLAPPDNAMGVLMTCGWMTGFPMRTGFGRGFPEHDPWRFDASRLVASGEADCALWISAYRPAAPDWQANVPCIALTGAGVRFRNVPHVHIRVGCPGIDHDGIAYLAATGTLAPIVTGKATATLSVADAIARIAKSLPAAAAWPC